MFTGIVEEVGRVIARQGSELTVEANNTIGSSKIGASIAVNGTCLTITNLDAETFSVDLSPETLRRTNLGALTAGCPVNLEQPLAYGGPVGGHLIQGHVDGTGIVNDIKPEVESRLFTFEAPSSIMRYLVAKGFISVDGVSLTVVERYPTAFTVTVIPYTLQHTVLGTRVPGDPVNIEVDILSKYVESFLNRGDISRI
jgi:riboflavin synthase